jgi:hypothetical protein
MYESSKQWPVNHCSHTERLPYENWGRRTPSTWKQENLYLYTFEQNNWEVTLRICLLEVLLRRWGGLQTIVNRCFLVLHSIKHTFWVQTEIAWRQIGYKGVQILWNIRNVLGEFRVITNIWIVLRTIQLLKKTECKKLKKIYTEIFIRQ